MEVERAAFLRSLLLAALVSLFAMVQKDPSVTWGMWIIRCINSFPYYIACDRLADAWQPTHLSMLVWVLILAKGLISCNTVHASLTRPACSQVTATDKLLAEQN
jgi:hypothetical protein